MTPLTDLSSPSLRDLVAGSTVIDAIPGLTQQALVWQLSLPQRRRELRDEAMELARPRLWSDTVTALASTTWRVLSAAAPDAPAALLTAASAAAGLPISPPRASSGLLRRTERLVRSGGPTYIKLGQLIASADGLLPKDWVAAFAWCRDQAPPLSSNLVVAIIEERLGDTGVRVDPEPIAAGSIGQVHAAVLPDGREAVVKIQRPGLHRLLRSDIGALALAAATAERVYDAASAANLSGFLELFAQLVLEELDFRLEALNLVETNAIIEHSGLDYARVPRPIPGLVTDSVLVMERVSGVPYDRALLTPGIEADGDALLGLAITGVLTTTLRYGLFHGDLHAGNVFVAPGGGFSLVDFGICGRLDERQRTALLRYLVSFAASDPHGQIKALSAFGAIPADADIAQLAGELTRELERIDNRTDGAITFERLGDTIRRLLAILVAHGFRMPKELVLFFKNLLYLSGFAANIAPDADLFHVIETALGDIYRS